MKKEVLEKKRWILGKKIPGRSQQLTIWPVIIGDLGKLDEALLMEKEVLEKRKRVPWWRATLYSLLRPKNPETAEQENEEL